MAGPLRVVFQSPGWPADRFANGICTYVANVRRGLLSLGVQSRVLAAQVAPNVDAADPEAVDLAAVAAGASLYDRALFRAYEALQGGYAPQVRLASTIARALRALCVDWPADLFELEETFGLAQFVAPWTALPVIVRLHGPWFLVAPALGLPDDRACRRRDANERRGLAAAAAVSSPSRYVLEQVRRRHGLALPLAAVIPNPGPVVPPERRWQPARGGVQTVLFVGRFDRLKGADLAVRAFCRIARARPRVQLALVGPDRGLVDDAGCTWTLPAFLDAQVPGELRGRVRALGERMGVEIAELRRAAAVTIVPSRYETFPMTALEALASGSPLVAAAVGGVPEIVEDGVTGLLVPGGEEEALAAAVARLLDDGALAARLGARGGQEAAGRFSPDGAARQTRAFYEEVLADRR